MLPDKKDIGLTLIGLRHGAAEISLPVLDVCLLIKDLDEVKVAVVRLLELVERELEVDLLLLLGADDPGAVQRHAVTRGVAHVLGRDVGAPWNRLSLFLFELYDEI